MKIEIPSGTGAWLALTLVVTLILGAYTYAWTIDTSAVKQYQLTEVLTRLGKIETLLLNRLPRPTHELHSPTRGD